MKVRLAPQVAAFVRTLAPEPRRKLRQALRDLERGRGEVKGLDGPLQEYSRLRVGPYRVILSYDRARSTASSLSVAASSTRFSPMRWSTGWRVTA